MLETHAYRSFDDYMEAKENEQRLLLELESEPIQRAKEERRLKLRQLNIVNHGHDFSCGYRCRCGITARDYHATRPCDRGVIGCPRAQEGQDGT